MHQFLANPSAIRIPFLWDVMVLSTRTLSLSILVTAIYPLEALHTFESNMDGVCEAPETPEDKPEISQIHISESYSHLRNELALLPVPWLADSSMAVNLSHYPAIEIYHGLCLPGGLYLFRLSPPWRSLPHWALHPWLCLQYWPSPPWRLLSPRPSPHWRRLSHWPLPAW